MANIKQINFNDEGEPEKVLLELDLGEAALITLLVGKSPNEINAIMKNGSGKSQAVYKALTNKLFQAYYEDGVNEAIQSLK